MQSTLCYVPILAILNARDRKIKYDLQPSYMYNWTAEFGATSVPGVALHSPPGEILEQEFPRDDSHFLTSILKEFQGDITRHLMSGYVI